MSWRSSRWLVMLAVLAACGFHPLYTREPDEKSAGSVIFAGVKVDAVAGERSRLAQQFRSDLEDRLNPDGSIPTHPAYRLSVTLGTSEVAIGASRDGTVSRYNVYLDSSYALYRTSDNKQITGGSVRHVSSYSNQYNAYYSTYISEQDALSRGVTELAELYRARLATYFEQGAPVQKIKKLDPNHMELQNPYLANPFNAELPQQTPTGLRQ